MPSKRDALIVAVTAIAVVASIASDPGVADVAQMPGLDLGEEPIIVDITVDIAPQRLETSFSAMTTNVAVQLRVETDAEGADSIDSIASTLFAVDADGARGANLSSIDELEIALEEGSDGAEVFATSRSHDVTISDCTSAPCQRTFELEIDVNAAGPFAAVGFVRAQAFSAASQGIVVTTTLRP